MYTIIGAGIGGLTTALVFEKLNIKYQLFEKAKGPNALGAGIWLAPNALQVMEFAGVLDTVTKVGNVVNRITLANQKLKPLADSSQLPAKEKYGFSTLAIHRAKLQLALIQSIPKEKIHWNKAFKFFKEEQDALTIAFQDGSTIKSKYLIAADGIDSKVRAQLFPKSKIRYSGQTCWRGVMQHPLPLEFKDRGIEMWGKGIRFGLSQLSETETSWFAVKNSKAFQKDDKTVLKNKLTFYFKEFHPLVNELINKTEINHILRNDITDLKPIKSWQKGNICLIGDAAHATTPNMGQGGAQAIEDAYYLGKLIAKHPNKNNFEQFEKKRFKRVNSIVKQSWFTGKIANLNTGTAIRNAIFSTIPKKMIDRNMYSVYDLKD
ncbi:2-polyprenyl-6-methoxyphenol hydroxylase-like FAD-dependent oxidoreductase [Lacinutrix venerupis]|uniref:FAD-dependent monooxygenase n=1 Tax=Lacinutrix venerupis TaxID=1486034 RepID=UPI000EAF917E|nr:FAD-dependent monooxygenase [Lacinutrix venerupis]RLJ68838.1 2-polyprenyl-6-methoxyphenol hydroxylase-like FAD-dependent oxidoreductase [Lacinutrix venerupis]